MTDSMLPLPPAGGSRGGTTWPTLHALPGAPAGTPLSRVLQISLDPSFDRIRPVIRAIESIHGLGPLTFPPVPVRFDATLANLGELVPDTLGFPDHISLRPSQMLEELVFCHEVGHLLDRMVMGDPGQQASVWDHANVRPVLDAIRQSKAYGELRIILRTGAASVQDSSGQVQTVPVGAHHVIYLLHAQEAWARAYSQYVALRSGLLALRDEIDLIRTPGPGKIFTAAQWTDGDFVPVADAFDRLLLDRGLRQ